MPRLRAKHRENVPKSRARRAFCPNISRNTLARRWRHVTPRPGARYERSCEASCASVMLKGEIIFLASKEVEMGRAPYKASLRQRGVPA